MHTLLHSQKFQQPVSCITSNEQFIAAGDISGSASIWKVNDINPWKSPLFHQILPTSMGVSDIQLQPTSNILYISSLDSSLQKYQLETDNTTMIQVKSTLMSNYKLDLNGDTLVTAGWHGKLFLYQKETLLKIQEIKTGDQFLNSVYRMRDRRLIATGNSSGTLHLVNLKKDNKLAYFPIHKEAIRNLKIIEDRFEVITVSDDKTIKVFDVNKEQMALSFTSEGAVMGLDLNPKDQNLFITGGADKTVSVWDLRQKGTVAKYERQASIWSLKYWRTGRTWMAGLEDGTFEIHSL